MTLKIVIYYQSFLSFLFYFTSHKDLFRAPFSVFRDDAKMMSVQKFRILTSLLTLLVSCSSPWARQNFSAPLKTEQILSHR